MRLFKPIIQLMNYLKDGQKFSFIGIILGIPIVLLTMTIIADINRDIEVKRQQVKGVYYSAVLKDVIQDVQL